MKHALFIISTLCIFTFCAGCSTAGPAATKAVASPESTPVAPPDMPVPPVGSPTDTLVEFPSGKFYNGGFDSYLVINDDGTWRLLEGKNRTFFTGKYQVEGEQVTFTDQSGYCSEFGNGVYSRKFSEDVLSIDTIDDDCKLRTARVTLLYTLQ